jgi:D-glycero-D-manno-heptose 1,7-bisphosphate phosphatase
MPRPTCSGRRAVFLDRDGVINRAFARQGRPYPPASVADLQVLPGVPAACEELRQRGFLVVVVTNQPDIARGTMSLSTLEAIHTRLRQRVRVDSIWVCPHDDSDTCRCRKPAPGLLLQAAAHHQIDLSQSFMVGDRWRDAEAGRAAGCRTLFVDRGYDESRPAEVDARVRSLPEAVAWICSADSIEKVHQNG